VLVQPICAPELRTALATALSPGVAGVARPSIESRTIYRVDRGGVATLDLGRAECDRYLAVTNLPGAPEPARARFLVREDVAAAPATPGGEVVVAPLTPPAADGSAATANASPGATVRTGDTPAGPAAPPIEEARVKIRIRSVRIQERRPDGEAWDVLNGPVPDPYVVVYRGSVLVGRTPVVEDRYQAAFDFDLDDTAPRTADTTLRFDVVDEDAAFDDPIGSARIDGARLPARAGEVTLPLLLPGERRPSGWLTIWVEPAAPGN
jgi:hypothetical protein